MSKYPVLQMSPPSQGSGLLILHEGREKHGWSWLLDEGGYWWGAKRNEGFILQVQPSPPDFLTRRWSETMGGEYTPNPKWQPLGSLIELI